MELTETNSNCKIILDNGIEVTNQCTKKKVLAEMNMQMFQNDINPQEIREALGVSADTVQRILHNNNVYIRKSWGISEEIKCT